MNERGVLKPASRHTPPMITKCVLVSDHFTDGATHTLVVMIVCET